VESIQPRIKWAPYIFTGAKAAGAWS
jgi:hypothetical protein